VRVGLSLLTNALDFIGRSSAMLSRLVDNRRCQQLGRIEFADRETIEPSLLTARQAMKLGTADVPKLDVDAVRAALAKEQDRHGQGV
jgi:hypothetical protein